MSEHYFEFKNVSKSFDDNAVLKDVSFFVEQGETGVIMGRSGVGKSVSLKLLLGFLEPDAGPDSRRGAGRDRLERRAVRRSPAPRDDGVSIRARFSIR